MGKCEKLYIYKEDNVVIKLVLNSGKLYRMNMVLILPELTVENQIYS